MGVPSLSLWIPLRVSSLYTVCISTLNFFYGTQITHIYIYISWEVVQWDIQYIYICKCIHNDIWVYHEQYDIWVCDTIWTCKLIMILYGYLSLIQYRDTNFMGTFHGIYIYTYNEQSDMWVCLKKGGTYIWPSKWEEWWFTGLFKASPSLDNTTVWVFDDDCKANSRIFSTPIWCLSFRTSKKLGWCKI